MCRFGIFGGNVMNTEQADIKFEEAQLKINAELTHRLDVVGSLDVEELMTSIQDMLNVDRKIIYFDNHLIHIKVDRRKNINLIRDQIQEEIEGMVGVNYVKVLFKIHVANNMIVIKRRR